MARFSTVLSLLLISSVNGFTTSFLGSPAQALTRKVNNRNNVGSMTMRVVDIDSEEAFDQTISSAGDSLVVVDYSTTWCGPCKVIAPKFDEMSEKYSNAVFLKVRSFDTWKPRRVME